MIIGTLKNSKINISCHKFITVLKIAVLERAYKTTVNLANVRIRQAGVFEVSAVAQI